jgi:Fic family protein
MDFKSGNYRKPGDYRFFQPERINHSYHFDQADLLPLLESANLKLGELNGYAELVPDVDHFIRLHVLKEATVSSRIEGTQTRMEEALLKEAEVDPEKKDDWKEVNNYITAMNQCIGKLHKLPLSTRLLKDAHKILLQSVRGKHKVPGEFRVSQNWIGGSSPQDAFFVPPPHHEVDGLMGDLENFLHNPNTGLPHVIKIAIGHYQFETIHPFLDGNGRIGRLMIPLYLLQAGVLKRPVLYISDFFERNRAAYYDRLTGVRAENDLKSWLVFFLTGLTETAGKSVKGLRKILDLKKDCEEKRIRQLGKKMPQAHALLNHLFKEPLIRPLEVAKVTGLSAVSAYKLLDDFEELKILREMTGNKRNRIFWFAEYFRAFR